MIAHRKENCCFSSCFQFADHADNKRATRRPLSDELYEHNLDLLWEYNGDDITTKISQGARSSWKYFYRRIISIELSNTFKRRILWLNVYHKNKVIERF